MGYLIINPSDPMFLYNQCQREVRQRLIPILHQRCHKQLTKIDKTTSRRFDLKAFVRIVGMKENMRELAHVLFERKTHHKIS